MSSSEQGTISTFRSADLPKVCIPTEFESSMESSRSDNEGDFIFKVPKTSTDLTPATSTPTELGSTLFQVALSSQTSEESDNTAPATRVSFDGSWHRRGIKDTPGLLKSKRGKSLTTSLTTSFTNACVTNVSDGRKNV